MNLTWMCVSRVVAGCGHRSSKSSHTCQQEEEHNEPTVLAPLTATGRPVQARTPARPATRSAVRILAQAPALATRSAAPAPVTPTAAPVLATPTAAPALATPTAAPVLATPTAAP